MTHPLTETFRSLLHAKRAQGRSEQGIRSIVIDEWGIKNVHVMDALMVAEPPQEPEIFIVVSESVITGKTAEGERFTQTDIRIDRVTLDEDEAVEVIAELNRYAPDVRGRLIRTRSGADLNEILMKRREIQE